MKHPFLLASSLILVLIITMAGMDIGADLLTQANTIMNAGGLFVYILTAFCDYKILKFSFKKFS